MDRRKRKPTSMAGTYEKRQAALADLGFRDYGEYLASPLWRQIKNRVLLRHGKLCAACRVPTRTVHHRNYGYETLAGENDGALVPLCDRCHTFAEIGQDGKKRHDPKVINGVVDWLIENGGVPKNWRPPPVPVEKQRQRLAGKKIGKRARKKAEKRLKGEARKVNREMAKRRKRNNKWRDVLARTKQA